MGEKQTKILMELTICLEVYGQFFKVFIVNCNFQLSTNTWHSWEKFDDYERKRLQNQNAQFIYYKTVLMTSLIYFVCVF